MFGVKKEKKIEKPEKQEINNVRTLPKPVSGNKKNSKSQMNLNDSIESHITNTEIDTRKFKKDEYLINVAKIAKSGEIVTPFFASVSSIETKKTLISRILKDFHTTSSYDIPEEYDENTIKLEPKKVNVV